MKRGRTELIELLREQLAFLEDSGRSFDAGVEAEAKRLATVIRVLVHDTGSSSSLLKQLGIKHQLRYLDTAERPARGPGILIEQWSVGLGGICLDADGVRFEAPLRDLSRDNFGWQSFPTWWNRVVLADKAAERFTRKDLVLFLANKEGGAHVDQDLPARRFLALARYNTLKWGKGVNEDGHHYVTAPMGPADEPLGNPIPVNVRQIAFELEETIHTRLGNLLGPTAASQV